MTRADRLRAMIPAVMRLYWQAKTRQQENDAYFLARALGLPAAYDEDQPLTGATP